MRVFCVLEAAFLMRLPHTELRVLVERGDSCASVLANEELQRRDAL